MSGERVLGKVHPNVFARLAEVKLVAALVATVPHAFKRTSVAVVALVNHARHSCKP